MKKRLAAALGILLLILVGYQIYLKYHLPAQVDEALVALSSEPQFGYTIQAEPTRLSLLDGDLHFGQTVIKSKASSSRWSFASATVDLDYTDFWTLYFFGVDEGLQRLDEVPVTFRGLAIGDTSVAARIEQLNIKLQGPLLQLPALLQGKKALKRDLMTQLTATDISLSRPSPLQVDGLDFIGDAVSRVDTIRAVFKIPADSSIIHLSSLSVSDPDISLNATGMMSFTTPSDSGRLSLRLAINNAPIEIPLYPSLGSVSGRKLRWKARLSLEHGDQNRSFPIPLLVSGTHRLVLTRPHWYPTPALQTKYGSFLKGFGIDLQQVTGDSLTAAYHYERSTRRLRLDSAKLHTPMAALDLAGSFLMQPNDPGASRISHSTLTLTDLSPQVAQSFRMMEQLFGLKLDREGDRVLLHLYGTLDKPHIRAAQTSSK